MEVMKQYRDKDEQLFAQVKKLMEGDFSSYNEIYTLSEKYIYKIINDIVRNHHITEDLMQEAYVQIYNKINTLREPKAFYVWAGRISTNLALRYIQKNAREILLTTEDGDGAEFIFDTVSQDQEQFIPESVLMDREKQRLIAEIIENLSTEQKICIQYFYYEEMSVNEIAQAMGCSVGTVKSRLNYARKSIRNAVVELDEKHGTRLYSLSAVPLFLLVFRATAEGLLPVAASMGAGAAVAMGSAGVSPAAGGAVSASAIGSAGVTPVAGSASVAAVGSAGATPVAGSASVVGSAGTTAAAGSTGAAVTAGTTGAAAAAGTGMALGVKAVIVTAVTVALAWGGVNLVNNTFDTPAESIEQVIEMPESTPSMSVEDTLADLPVMAQKYEDMGVSKDMLAERINSATRKEYEIYKIYEELCNLYDQLIEANRNCLSPEQFAVMQESLFNTTDQGIAMGAIGVEEFLAFVARYEEYPEIQEAYNLQEKYLKATNATTEAAIALLNHPLSKQIMAQISTDTLAEYVMQGYNVQMVIQTYLMEYNDGTYNDLVDPANNVAYQSENMINTLVQYAEYAAGNEVVMQLNQEYMAQAGAEQQAYYQQLVDYYNGLFAQ